MFLLLELNGNQDRADHDRDGGHPEDDLVAIPVQRIHDIGGIGSGKCFGDLRVLGWIFSGGIGSIGHDFKGREKGSPFEGTGTARKV